MVRYKRKVAVLLLLLVALGSFGCLGASLSEEAKPQSPAEHFIVSVTTYNLLAEQATVWLQGVTEAAKAGDEAAEQYKGVAMKIGKILVAGNVVIQLGARSVVVGDQGGLEGAAATLDSLILQLQAAGFASAAGG